MQNKWMVQQKNKFSTTFLNLQHFIKIKTFLNVWKVMECSGDHYIDSKFNILSGELDLRKTSKSYIAIREIPSQPKGSWQICFSKFILIEIT